MANKTKFSIDVKFDGYIPVKLSPMKSIQKGADKGSVGVSVTDATCTCPSIMVHWDEVTDPINKMVTLAIKEISVDIVVKCAIQYSREIDRKSPCYAHIVKHEYLHVNSRKASVKKYKPVMIKFIEQAVWPTMDKPQTMKASKAKALRASAFKKIDTAVQEACGKFMTLSNAESKKIDSKSENDKTTRLCKEFI